MFRWDSKNSICPDTEKHQKYTMNSQHLYRWHTLLSMPHSWLQ